MNSFLKCNLPFLFVWATVFASCKKDGHGSNPPPSPKCLISSITSKVEFYTEPTGDIDKVILLPVTKIFYYNSKGVLDSIKTQKPQYTGDTVGARWTTGSVYYKYDTQGRLIQAVMRAIKPESPDDYIEWRKFVYQDKTTILDSMWGMGNGWPAAPNPESLVDGYNLTLDDSGRIVFQRGRVTYRDFKYNDTTGNLVRPEGYDLAHKSIGLTYPAWQLYERNYSVNALKIQEFDFNAQGYPTSMKFYSGLWGDSFITEEQIAHVEYQCH